MNKEVLHDAGVTNAFVFISCSLIFDCCSLFFTNEEYRLIESMANSKG